MLVNVLSQATASRRGYTCGDLYDDDIHVYLCNELCTFIYLAACANVEIPEFVHEVTDIG